MTYSTLSRKTPMKRSKPRRTRTGRATRASQRARVEVAERSGGVCEARIAGYCRGRASEMHHRLRRSQGGTDLTAGLVDLCAACHHEAIHAHPDWAYRHGWLIPSGGKLIDPVTGCGLDCDRDHREDR